MGQLQDEIKVRLASEAEALPNESVLDATARLIGVLNNIVIELAGEIDKLRVVTARRDHL